MWKEWTSKIKSFAEDIASPDYDDERPGSSGEAEDDKVEGRVEPSRRLRFDTHSHAHPKNDMGVARAAAHDPNTSEAVYSSTDGASALKTSLRCLPSQYDQLTGDQYAGPCGSSDAAVYPRTPSVSAVAEPSSSSLSPSPPSTRVCGTRNLGNVGPLMASPQAVAATESNGAAPTSAACVSDSTAVSNSFSSRASDERTSASAVGRRGPPEAMVTSSSQLKASQDSTVQHTEPLSSASGATISFTSQPKSEIAVLRAPSHTDVLAHRSACQQHLPGEAQILAQRVSALEAEKVHMQNEVRKYQDHVRAEHERTVLYYEKKLREAAAIAETAASVQEANAQQQAEALRATLQQAEDQLEQEKALKRALEMRVAELQQEAEELRASLADMHKKIEAMPATAAPASMAAAPPPGSLDESGLPAEEHWRLRHSEEVNSLKVALHEKSTHLAAQTAQLQSAEAIRRSLEAKLQEAETAMANIKASHEKSAGSVREEPHPHARLQNETDQLNREVEAARHRDAAAEQLFEDAQRRTKQDVATQLTNDQAISKVPTVTLEQTRKSTCASAATAAASEAHDVERHRLTEKLVLMETEREVLQQQLIQLTESTERLQRMLDAREHEHAVTQAAHAEAQKALLEKANAVEVEAKKDRNAYQEKLQQLEMQLVEEQHREKTLEADKLAAEQARMAAEAQAASMEQYCSAIKAELADLQQQRVAESGAKESSANMSVAVLTRVKKELEEKVHTLEVTIHQLRRMTVDTLVRLDVDVERVSERSHPHREGTERETSGVENDEVGDKEGVKGGAAAHTEVPLLQLFSLLMTECLQQHSIVVRAERVQQEWEQTYEQARRVNDSLNQQMADAWSTIGKLREEVSLKDDAARQMKVRVDSGDTRLVEVQEHLASVMHELQTLREEREGWAARLQQAETGAEGQANTVSSMQEELNVLQDMLQAKEEELQACLQSSENLQLVLDRIQENKRREVEALTLESQLEAEELKKQLAQAQRIRDQHESDLARVREGFERQLAAKDAEVTTMHRKLAEMRKVLEKTTSRHMDGSEMSIDKRVISELLAKYMHAFFGQQKEAEDMLKVLSGLLDWDEATQESVGLLPGPNNPHPPDGSTAQRGGARRGLFRWLRSGAKETNKAGLASMWVEFLLKESEGSGADGRAHHRDAGAATSTLALSTSTSLGSHPNPSLSVPSPSAEKVTVTPEAAAATQSP
ncbi:hypothetical protein, conserved [Leishmania tarentolae]|uniref:GRIP domain-containing protein n=1 Tax=Leishmania tarentolae TaxID=5689 RepID=A0A640KSD5_LEITA|nr:hypothetical protein, conserved [Leishmania tarentolae]